MATRRSPKPEERRRDAERTREALLEAALSEFSAKGLAGARVSEIAARAGVDKQLISYYFGGKEGLYRALFQRWLDQEEQFATPELSLEDLVARYVTDSVEHREMHRLFLREGLDEDAATGLHPADDSLAAEIADLRLRQERGEIAADLDPALLLLVLTGAVSVAVTLPGDVRKATGLDPDSPEFAERYAEQLRRIVRRLA